MRWRGSVHFEVAREGDEIRGVVRLTVGNSGDDRRGDLARSSADCNRFGGRGRISSGTVASFSSSSSAFAPSLTPSSPRCCSSDTPSRFESTPAYLISTAIGGRILLICSLRKRSRILLIRCGESGPSSRVSSLSGNARGGRRGGTRRVAFDGDLEVCAVGEVTRAVRSGLNGC